MEPIGFHSILILLGVAVVLVALFRYMRLPQILAYLCAGIVVGPYGMGWIPDLEGTRTLAEFGLVFLMFTVGLEFSLPRLVAMKAMVFGLGGAQVLISSLVFGFVAWLFGVSPGGAIVIGGMLAMSSTAIVMKLLTEQLEQNSRHGHHAISMLLFQDLIVVPFLIFIPALGGNMDQSVWVSLGWALLKSVLVLVGIFIAGRWLLRPFFHEVASAKLREYFMLAVLLLTLTAAWITEMAGLSLALGAFLAGMMMGETEYRHQVEGDILPFRDILLGLFFITIGMMLNLGAMRELWPGVLLCVVVIVVFKTLLILGLGKLFAMETGVALRTGLVMSQVGEFAFALLLSASQFDLFSEAVSQIVLASVILSMMAAPLIVRYNGYLAKRWVPGYTHAREGNLDAIRAEAVVANKHVIICGYGRSGQNLAWMLEQEGIPNLALDLDPVRVRDARDAGKSVVYGDVARRDVLEAAGLHRATALAISFYNTPAALKILEVTRHVRPDMPVIVRTMDDVDLERLKAAGATEVVPESLEGSLMMGSHLLLLMGVPVSRIVRHVRDVRTDRYRMLRGFFHGEDVDEGRDPSAYQERLHSISLPAGAYAVGRLISELHLEEAGVNVNAVRRGGIRGPEPSPETKLAAGDVLVLYGAPDALEQAEKILLEG
ncbi:MAG: monovalent cation:proton antiporter-2 (CPA2) family protein [Sulfuricaulis sp.]|uniref:monovalent cation:proton antiporter-2 (CPA2) family protein n=1 Tax=Sulfuricaulis sp. TaxID=2003553 RepID=UPI0025CD41E5|nr:monovalent cation:proton antiporter-2 (CPA2) family protein [Sulfuricaulis sp.]MCR4347054.1 monovalent cation:proton antiporter-2 (CPA2) family protein [Sulfuricaulis sp.]